MPSKCPKKRKVAPSGASSIAGQDALYCHDLPQLALGIDEAGRGCLAGPVVAAAVLLPSPCPIDGLDDSKKLSAARREKLAPRIKEVALAWGIGVVWQGSIDEKNILQATYMAMSHSAGALARRYARAHHAALPSCFLHIDGNKTIPPAVLGPHWPEPSLPMQVALVNGDALEKHIGAASILAKTFRDRLMTVLHRRWPEYNFAGHKGYGTAEHLAALLVHGPCPLHRLTFAKVLPETEARKKNTKKKSAALQDEKQGSLL